MLDIINEYQSLFCHWKFFKNSQPLKKEGSFVTRIFERIFIHQDSFYIFLKEDK